MPTNSLTSALRRTASSTLLAALTAYSGHASAQTTPTSNETGKAYGTIGIMVSTLKETVGTAYSTRPALIIATLGYELYPYLAIEAQLGMGVRKGSAEVAGKNTTTSINSVAGLYLKPQYAINPNWKIYGKIGRADVRMSSTVAGAATAGLSETSTSYGLGLSYQLGKDLVGTLEYMSYLNAKKANGGKVTLSGVQLGLEMKY